MPMVQVIVVAGDSGQQSAMAHYLSLVGMRVRRAGSNRDLDALLAISAPDLLVLDADLPDEDAFAIVARLRSSSRMGILILTEQDRLDDKVLALTAGADACLDKPIQFRELEAVIRSLLRRLKTPSRHDRPDHGAAVQKAWRFDATDWALTSPNGGTVLLTNAEYVALQALIARPGASVKREEIARSLGKVAGGYDDRSINALFSRLRRKVQTASGELLPIRSARGVGYAFTAPIERRHPPMAAIA